MLSLTVPSLRPLSSKLARTREGGGIGRIKKLFREQFIYGFIAQWIKRSPLIGGLGVRFPLGHFFIFFFYNFHALHDVRRIIRCILFYCGRVRFCLRIGRLLFYRFFTVIRESELPWRHMQIFWIFKILFRLLSDLAGSARRRRAGLLLSARRQRIMLF